MDALRYERYSSVPLFDGLQPEEIGALLGYSEERIVEAGDIVIGEGDIPGHFFIVAQGTLDVIKTEGENPTVLARYGRSHRLSNGPGTGAAHRHAIAIER